MEAQCTLDWTPFLAAKQPVHPTFNEKERPPIPSAAL